MNKVICDICGTSYVETAQCCPICGSSREYALKDSGENAGGMPEYIPSGRKSGGAFSASNKKAKQAIYDVNAPESDQPQDIFPEETSAHSGAAKHNYFAVIGFTAMIFLFLIGSGFLFFRYYMPNQRPEPELAAVTDAPATQESTQETMEEPSIPCESITLMAGAPELNRIGQYWLLHVIVSPSDTTDTLQFISTDESVVTVTEEGRLCAVAEGEASVLITCGNKQILCGVTVRLGATPETAQDVPEMTEPEEEQIQSETFSENPTDEPTEEPSEEPTEDPVEESTEPSSQPENTDVVLKIRETDISFGKKGVTYELHLECELDPKDIKWITMNPKVAICHDGVITIVGAGTTRIVATYGGQEVSVIVRVNLK